MTLHQINRPHYTSPVERDWLLSLQDGDSVLLFESGVLRSLKANPTMTGLSIDKSVTLYVRSCDVKAHGLSVDESVYTIIDDNQWLELTASCERIISW
ncbi:DsrH/TusB family sulfur metabolism protein [Marinomonas balearica]|uniref:tRNA 2-thiouridine synthesizing protein B n=1 Tax=Marinomonas balearica TaxID=491947 RepID=A0A4R6MDV1_9GAMM|nr:DsrH/TusB family sulfur metabolism protein [Marinomonas balearica]TDO98910.1 tRNA 2-thiouridine synthesizing protein B [Marinomonas balearica]